SLANDVPPSHGKIDVEQLLLRAQRREYWRAAGGVTALTGHVPIIEVSIVALPAYEDTSVTAERARLLWSRDATQRWRPVSRLSATGTDVLLDSGGAHRSEVGRGEESVSMN